MTTMRQFLCTATAFTLTIVLSTACEKKAPPEPANAGESGTNHQASEDANAKSNPKENGIQSSKTPQDDGATQGDKSSANPSDDSASNATGSARNNVPTGRSRTPVVEATVENAVVPDPPLPVTGPQTMEDGRELDVRQESRDGVVTFQWCEERLADGAILKEGPFARWHPEGGPYMKGMFRNGVYHGPIYSWHRNGQLRGIGQFDNGLKTGRWINWDDNGVKRVERYYQGDLLNGPWKDFDENGEPTNWGEYVTDRKHGIWHTKQPDGTITETRWDNGTEVKQ